MIDSPGPQGPRARRPGRARGGRQDVIVPSTSLSLVEARLPVIVVLSALAVPKVATPPPMPDAELAGRAGLARRGRAAQAAGAGRGAPAGARRPPEALAAMLVVMTSVALACLEPFFAPSRGLMVRVPVVALKMPPPEPIPPAPPLAEPPPPKSVESPALPGPPLPPASPKFRPSTPSPPAPPVPWPPRAPAPLAPPTATLDEIAKLVMADRSETTFAAVVSRSVLTWNVVGVTRSSSPSSPGRTPRRFAIPFRIEYFSMVFLSRRW